MGRRQTFTQSEVTRPFKPADLRRAVTEWAERGFSVRIEADGAITVTPRFANYIVQVLRVLMEHAIDLGWRDDNPCKGVSLLKSTGDKREAWPPALIEAYRATATGRALLIFELCLGTGQRIGDVLEMRWSDIDGDGIKVTQNKTGARLWIPFTARLRAVLDETPRIGLTICAWGRHGRPSAYRGAADLVMAVRKRSQHGSQHSGFGSVPFCGPKSKL